MFVGGQVNPRRVKERRDRNMRPFVRIIGACFLATVGLVAVIVAMAYVVGGGEEELAVREESWEPVVREAEAPEAPVVEIPAVAPPVRQEEAPVATVQPKEVERRIGGVGKGVETPREKAPKKMSEKEYLDQEEVNLTAIQTSTEKVLARGEEQRAKWNAQNAEVNDLLYQD